MHRICFASITRRDPFARSLKDPLKMQRFRNMPLAVRLGLGFGTLALGLVLVSLLAFSDLSKTQADTQEAGGDFRATHLVGGLLARAEGAAHLTAQHLYVYDGDLRAQDKLVTKIEALDKRNDE